MATRKYTDGGPIRRNNETFKWVSAPFDGDKPLLELTNRSIASIAYRKLKIKILYIDHFFFWFGSFIHRVFIRNFSWSVNKFIYAPKLQLNEIMRRNGAFHIHVNVMAFISTYTKLNRKSNQFIRIELKWSKEEKKSIVFIVELTPRKFQIEIRLFAII